MKQSLRFLRVLAVLPLAVGLCGFVLLAGYPILDAAFKCVTMYVLNYGETPPNFLVEIARWTAPLATASGVVLAVSSLQGWMSARWKYLRGGSVAVYGPEEEADAMLALLEPRSIRGREKLVRAERYILLGDETKSFAFYQENLKQLKSRKVYIKCISLPAQSVSKPNLKLFCPEEIAARLFWQQRDVYSLWKDGPGDFSIVMLGFGKLGEELLRYGLQGNLFAADQQLQYHIFGDCDSFLAIHTELDNISDQIIRHETPWYKELPLLERADLVIVLQQQDQTALLQGLLTTTLRREIDVFAAEYVIEDFLEQKERLRIFDWRSQAMDIQRLFEDALYLRAKRLHLRYCHLYQGISETEENMEREWSRLDAFTRYSNVSAADYHERRLEMMAAQGIPTRADKLCAQDMEMLAELEHIRWCRYHYINNWRYGQLENGKVKDPLSRVHSLLRPYSELPETEKEKNRENIRILLSIK